MRIQFLIFIFVFAISCICFADSNFTESLTITTYYPSPYGVYGILKLNPRPRPSEPCHEGEMTYGNNSVPKGIYFCNSTNQWAQLGGSEFWTEDTATNNIHNSNTGGRVGIGTTAPTERLEVNGNIKATGNVLMSGDWVTSGNVTAAAFYSSDLKLKKNIQPLKGSLDRVSRLQGISFQWRNNNREDIGLAAQEVEKVYPELVSTDRNTGLKSVEYGNLIAALIESIKEQQEQIRELKAEVAGFKK